MTCRDFVLELEDFLEAHPDLIPERAPRRLSPHVDSCPACSGRWRTAIESRRLLTGLRPAAPAVLEGDFSRRVGSRIEAGRARAAWEACRNLVVGRRDLVLAVVLFAFTLGSFVYNYRQIERPNIDEAFALDVPHLYPQQPSEDHVQPKDADAMLNLMNP